MQTKRRELERYYDDYSVLKHLLEHVEYTPEQRRVLQFAVEDLEEQIQYAEADYFVAEQLQEFYSVLYENFNH
jgi:hypothetical protein